MANQAIVFLLFLMCTAQQQFVELTTDVDPRIIGGHQITINDAPYQVSVRLKSSESISFGYGFICGGSVISRRVVVTAAHCVANLNTSPVVYRNASEFDLVMGDTFLYIKTATTVQYDVLQIIHNAAFDPTTLLNDIALMFINGDVPSGSSAIRSISLNTIPLGGGTYCTVSGWGKINSISNTLMEALVPIVNNTQCSINYGYIPESMICAGFMQTGGVDACQGDSGGPLVCNNALVGIVSWGNGCAEKGYPGVYTNVSYYAGWIYTNSATFNFSYYSGAASATKVSTVLLGLVLLVVASLK